MSTAALAAQGWAPPIGAQPPAYGLASGLAYNAARNVANWKPSNTHKIRAGLMLASTGSYGDYAYVADSLGAGFNGNGNTNDQEQAFPAQLLDFLVANSGTKNPVINGGLGARFPAMAQGVLGSGHAMTGGFSVTNAPFLNTSTGGTYNYTSPRAVGGAGTATVEICYHGQSNNFSF